MRHKAKLEKISINNLSFLTANIRSWQHKIHEGHKEVSVCCTQDQSEVFSRRNVTVTS